MSSARPDTTGAARRLVGVVERLRTRIEAESRGLDALRVSGTTVQAVDLVTRRYEAQGFEPFWVSGTGPRASVGSLLAAYPLDRIAALKRTATTSDSIRVDDLADLELLCTDVFLLYASHVLTGRVAAVDLVPSWNIRQREADLLALLRDATASERIAAVLRTVRPRQPGAAGSPRGAVGPSRAARRLVEREDAGHPPGRHRDWTARTDRRWTARTDRRWTARTDRRRD